MGKSGVPDAITTLIQILLVVRVVTDGRTGLCSVVSGGFIYCSHVLRMDPRLLLIRKYLNIFYTEPQQNSSKIPLVDSFLKLFAQTYISPVYCMQSFFLCFHVSCLPLVSTGGQRQPLLKVFF